MKKVVLFIVEGLSDEAALNSSLKAFFNNLTHRFHVVHGDITSDRCSSPSNIKSRVGDLLKKFLSQYPIKKSDIVQIIQLIDTDGAFIPHEQVVYKDTKLSYDWEQICTDKVEAMRDRNTRKSHIVECLYSCSKISGIHYKMYYFSRNLEHVLYNEVGDMEDSQKIRLADKFDKQYKGNLEQFIALLSDPTIAPTGDYLTTWEFIKQGTNSLHRHSNLYLIFQKSLTD